jgi:hypothetical protein
MKIIFKKQKKNLCEFIYEFTSKMNVNDGYKINLRSVAKHLKEFSEKTGLPVNTDSFSEPVMEEFILFLKKKSLVAITVKNIYRMVVTALNKASKRGYPVDRGFEEIKVKGDPSNSVYLSIDELKKINELEGLSDSEKACRDRFLIGCFTAMRISDYGRLSIEDNFTDGYNLSFG